MIGVFDSGRGGIASLIRIRRALPMLDIAYLADRKNAPYGTKSKAELCELVEHDIARLKAFGVDEILIACCTAGTVYKSLKPSVQRGVFPIIERCAQTAAAMTDTGRVALVATEATVKSGAFGQALQKYGKELSLSVPLQSLVGIVEAGKPYTAAQGIIKGAAEKIKMSGADTLILGCTHFSYLLDVFESEFPDIKIVDAATVGATLMIERHRGVRERGRLIYL